MLRQFSFYIDKKKKLLQRCLFSSFLHEIIVDTVLGDEICT